jgi:hypothetical protein
MTSALSLDQALLRRELRELDAFDADWFKLTATATVAALREGRTCTVSTNVPEILDCCRRLAVALGATVEMIEGYDGVTDVVFRPPSRRKARPAASFKSKKGN